MRKFINATRIAAIVTLTSLACACGGEAETSETNVAPPLDSNIMLDAPANDASAMESVGDVVDPAPVLNAPAEEDGDALGETSGGDTGGNTIEGNVTGM